MRSRGAHLRAGRGRAHVQGIRHRAARLAAARHRNSRAGGFGQADRGRRPGGSGGGDLQGDRAQACGQDRGVRQGHDLEVSEHRRVQEHLRASPPMSIKSDKWIRRLAAERRMIEPFEPGQVKEFKGQRIVSYGTSSYGYDIRCSNEFKLFTNLNSTIVDPKNFDSNSFVDMKGDFCIIPPNSFALARTVEYFRIPRNVLSICVGKSTYARCFSADTRVALVDGTSPTLEEMARRADSRELFWGYSLGDQGRVIV